MWALLLKAWAGLCWSVRHEERAVAREEELVESEKRENLGAIVSATLAPKAE